MFNDFIFVALHGFLVHWPTDRFPPQIKVWCYYSSKEGGKIKHKPRGGNQYKLYTTGAAAAEPSVDDALDVVLSELDAIYTLKKHNVCTEGLTGLVFSLLALARV